MDFLKGLLDQKLKENQTLSSKLDDIQNQQTLMFAQLLFAQGTNIRSQPNLQTMLMSSLDPITLKKITAQGYIQGSSISQPQIIQSNPTSTEGSCEKQSSKELKFLSQLKERVENMIGKPQKEVMIPKPVSPLFGFAAAVS